MSAVVTAHINQFGGAGDTAVGGLDHGVGLADKGNDGAVCGLAGVYVEEADVVNGGNCGGNGIDYRAVASLAEIRDTFYQAFFHGL